MITGKLQTMLDDMVTWMESAIPEDPELCSIVLPEGVQFVTEEEIDRYWVLVRSAQRRYYSRLLVSSRAWVKRLRALQALDLTEGFYTCS